MLTATRALHSASSAEPLPLVPELSGLDIIPRRGQLCLIAGPPGAGKSTFVQWWVARMGLKTLYFSADMDAHDAITRLAACLSGDRTNAVSEALTGPAAAFYEGILGESSLQFAFDSAPTLDDIAEEVTAYVELHDAFPEAVIVDNLMNVEAEMGESYQGLLRVMSELHRLARVTGAAVFVLHHTTEGTSTTPGFPQPRREIQGKVSQLPEIVLTVALDSHSQVFRIAKVKYRSGRADATGRTFFELAAEPERASFSTYIPPLPYGWAS